MSIIIGYEVPSKALTIYSYLLKTSFLFTLIFLDTSNIFIIVDILFINGILNNTCTFIFTNFSVFTIKLTF